MIKTEIQIKEYDPMLFSDSSANSTVFTLSRALMDIDKLSVTKLVQISVDSPSEQLRKTILSDIIDIHLKSALIFNIAERRTMICKNDPFENYIAYSSETITEDNRFYLGNNFYDISYFIDPMDFICIYIGNEIGKQVHERLIKGG